MQLRAWGNWLIITQHGCSSLSFQHITYQVRQLLSKLQNKHSWLWLGIKSGEKWGQCGASP